MAWLKSPRSGLCIVRIEPQGRGVRITLRTNPDAAQISTERVHNVADVELAIQIIREFLRAFVASSERTKGSGSRNDLIPRNEA